VADEKDKLLKSPKDRTTTDSPVLELLIEYGRGTNRPRLMGSGGSRWHPHSKDDKPYFGGSRGGYSPTSRDKSASKWRRIEETPLAYESAKKYLKAQGVRPDNKYAEWAKGNRFPVGESLVKQARGVMLEERFKKKQLLENMPFFKEEIERKRALWLKKEIEAQRKKVEEDRLKKQKKFFEDITNNPDTYG